MTLLLEEQGMCDCGKKNVEDSIIEEESSVEVVNANKFITSDIEKRGPYGSLF